MKTSSRMGHIRLADAILIIACFAPFSEQTFGTEFVYDSLSNDIFFGGGSSVGSSEFGEHLTLGESSFAVISNMELGVNLTRVGITRDFRIRFYEFDSANLSPGTKLWESEVISITYTEAGPFITNIPVPNVRIPGAFVWTIQGIGDTGRFLLNGVPSPSLGNSVARVSTDAVSGEWRYFPRGNPESLGVRLTGYYDPVPEPVSLALACLGISALLAFRHKQ